MKSPIRLLFIMFMGMLALPCALADTLYKSVGADGRVTYSDQPPAQGKVLKTMTPILAPNTALPASAEEQLRRLRALRPAAAKLSGVVVYSAEWCGYCKKAKAYLSEKGISYREVDIDTPDGLAEFGQSGGGKGVPLLIANGQRVQGFSASAYDKAFAGR